MTSSVFGKEYADRYDTFYRDKNYDGECHLIEEVFRRYARQPVGAILDLGCGTGNHAIPLARQGYRVTGVDRSPEMIAQAKAKLQSQASPFQYQPHFLEGDVCSLDLDHKFDAVIMMFAVLGYQLTNDNLSDAFRTIRRHLRQGGLFVFDIWYGPAVLAIQPVDKMREIPTADGKIIRMASGTLDLRHHLCEVHYRLLQTVGDRIVSDSNETHYMRYFFPMELEHMLSCNDMKLESLTAFPDLEKPADETTWNALGIGTAI